MQIASKLSKELSGEGIPTSQSPCLPKLLIGFLKAIQYLYIIRIVVLEGGVIIDRRWNIDSRQSIFWVGEAGIGRGYIDKSFFDPSMPSTSRVGRCEYLG